MVEWQHKNEASTHRTAKEFAVDRKCVRKCYSTLNGKTRRKLGKCHCLDCGQPLSVDLDQKVFEFLEDERSKQQKLGMDAWEQGYISPLPPLAFD